MARIAGVDLPREKRAEIGLTYIYGIGRATANEILAKAEINPDVRIKDLSDDEYREVVKDIEELKEKYNFIEDIRDTFKGEYDETGFPFRKRILLSKMNLKK